VLDLTKMQWARGRSLKRHWIADFAAMVGLFVFFLPSIARAQVKTVEIPFSTSGGLIIVEAKINGKSASLLFDSGAMRTLSNRPS